MNDVYQTGGKCINLAPVCGYCNRGSLMADGLVVGDASCKDILSNPKKQRTRQFLAEVLK